MSKTKIILIVLGVILGILLLGAGTVYGVFHHYHEKSNYVKDEEVKELDEKEIPEEVLLENQDDVSAEEAKEEEEKALASQKEIEFPNGDYVYNLLLIGVDLRPEENWNGNSDVMLLASINKKTKTIYMTSFMRDTYAVVGDKGGRKLNFAHALGGGPLLVKTIEDNFKIKIDNYARGNFETTAKVIDIMGGVDVPLYQAECDYLTTAGAGNFPQEGTYHLTGDQAVAYGRIRYVGNNDYERTERQRRIVGEIFKKSKELSLTELNDVANEILPLITHNMDEASVLSLITQLPSLMSYDMEMNRIPYDGHFHSQGEKLVPEWDYTIQRLHDTIYATEKETTE